MELYKILLNDSEIRYTIRDEDIYHQFFEPMLYAQCLKLLEWLKQPCKEHNYCYLDFDEKGSAIQTDVEQHSCPECMSELEKALRG